MNVVNASTSPLWGAVAEPPVYLSRVISKREYQEAAWAADREAFQNLLKKSEERDRLVAARKRKPKRKAARDPTVAKEGNARWFAKNFIEPLASNLAVRDDQPGSPLVRFCQKLKSGEEQYIVAATLANGHELDTVEYRIERHREDPAFYDDFVKTFEEWKAGRSPCRDEHDAYDPDHFAAASKLKSL